MSQLRHLLDLIAGGQPCTSAGLANQLDVSQGLVEQMLADLERGGYLRLIESCSPNQCRTCAHPGPCSTSTVRAWMVVKTPKVG